MLVSFAWGVTYLAAAVEGRLQGTCRVGYGARLDPIEELTGEGGQIKLSNPVVVVMRFTTRL